MKVVKKTIADLVLKGDNAYTVKDLALIIYEISLDEIERRHTIPIVRAMKQLVDEYPQIEIRRGSWSGGKGRKMIILDRTSPMAQGVAYLKNDSRNYLSQHHRTTSEKDIMTRMEPAVITEGGSMYRRAEWAKAEIAGDTETVARFEKEREEGLAQLAAKLTGVKEGVTEAKAVQAMALLHTYAMTLDNPYDDLTLKHEGTQLVFSIRALPK